jgi:tRNA(Ile)-lysidine synthase
MVLLHVLAELAGEHRWKIIVAHLNHRLRGSSSLADERLVRRTARQLRLPAVISRVDVRGYALKHRLSIEMAARQLRHDFLARAARQRRILRIALAHHLDDQVELFFLRLFRGAGIRGLTGMKWRAPSPADRAVDLVRPLLDLSKADLLEYAAERRVDFRHDTSNDDRDIPRNRIRHELLPFLERKYQPDLRGKVARLMDLLAAESAFVESVARAWLTANRINGEGRAPATGFQTEGSETGSEPIGLEPFGSVPFETLPLAVQRRCIQLQVIQLGVQSSHELIERLRLQPEKLVSACRACLAQPGPGAAHPGEVAPATAACQLARELSGVVRLEPRQTHKFQTGSKELDLRQRKSGLKWHGVRLGWQVLPSRGTERPQPEPGVEFFDANVVGPVIRIRHWQPGDRFRPIGLDRAMKLQDLFVNQKVPRNRRHQLLLATIASGEIFWVEGLRISERFKLTRATIRRLHWRWQRL